MRNLLFLYVCILLMSCGQTSLSKKESLQEWVMKHEPELVSASDSLIQDYRKDHPKSDWDSVELAIANSMSGTLGMLAEKASDTTNCVVVELTGFRDTSYKPRIFLVATDSNCLKKLKEIELTTDSTKNIVFGKKEEALQ